METNVIRLILIFFVFLSASAKADIFDQYNELKDIAFSHYGLKLESNESILETLPDCETLESHPMFTHRCYDKTNETAKSVRPVYFLKFIDSKKCNQGFKRPPNTYLADPGEIKEVDALNAELPYNMCLVRYLVDTIMPEDSLKELIEKISTNYGPASDVLKQIEKPHIDYKNRKSIIPAKVIDESYIWDPSPVRNVIKSDWIEDGSDYSDRFLKIKVLRDFSEIVYDEKTNHPNVIIDVSLKGHEKRKIFEWSKYFKWLFYLVISYGYIFFTTKFVKDYVRKNFKENKEKVKYHERTINGYKVMYIYPAAIQIWTNLPALLVIGIIGGFAGLGRGIFSLISTPGFYNDLEKYHGDYKLLMIFSVIITIQLLITYINVRKYSAKYLRG